ncbi:hypothetical protein HT031_002914 [Scenedesmus sp. PABB004]|nr:hypothetical protein HT031_002914 [Scenedesmus sp. PABB004]
MPALMMQATAGRAGLASGSAARPPRGLACPASVVRAPAQGLSSSRSSRRRGGAPPPPLGGGAARTSPRGVACAGLFGLGLPEIAVIAGVAALIFGPSKLPELGKGLGKTVKSFQTAAQEFKTELEAAANADDDAPADGAAKPADAAAKKGE